MYQSREFLTLPGASEARDLFQEIASDRLTRGGRRVDKPLALYGAGSLGRMAREYLQRLDIPIQFVVDANAARLRQDPYWSGIDLRSPQEVSADMRESTLLALCVVTAAFAPLARHLGAEGWNDVVPFYDIAACYTDRHPLSNGWFAAPFRPEDEQGIMNTFEAWDDDTSLAHNLQFVAWRRLRQEWSFVQATLDTGNRFFIPEILAVLNNEERFLDAGAHLGHVTQTFIKHVSGHFSSICAIEPDRFNRQGLQAAIAQLPPEQQQRITVVPIVIGNQNTRARFFEGLDYASQHSDLGESTMECRTVDSLDLAPSFIKLHLEGRELEALEGAESTLRQCRPLVTATMYHNAEGLWRLPSWLMATLPEYRFHMRLHSWCGTGATIYAIPRERQARAPSA